MKLNLHIKTWGLLLIPIVTLMVILIIGRVQAGPYPESTVLRFAGMVKPQRGVVDYTGYTINGQYSTVWTGNYTYGSEGSGSHPGVDITEGDCQVTEVRAVAEGTVRMVDSTWLDRNTIEEGYSICGNNLTEELLPNMVGRFGNYVFIEHDGIPDRDGYGGTIFTLYAHLSEVYPNVAVGDKVLRGTVLGLHGSTGASSGPHLHFQIDKDRGEDLYVHPYWVTGAVSETVFIPRVQYYNFNPMRFVQAQEAETAFSSPGASVQFYPNINLDEPFMDQWIEAEIDHEWFYSGPLPPGFQNYFSARWQGYIWLPASHAWIFYVTVDDGVRLWIDNSLVIDQWC
jgi:murein DD-endopeptidase MepM/ murein hydrolase activator NlpD